MIILFSDIRLDDNNSASLLLKPLICELEDYSHVIVCPKNKENIDKQLDNIIFINIPFYKNRNLFLRAISEILLPIIAFYNVVLSPKIKLKEVDKIVTYSPSIFTTVFVILMRIMKRSDKIHAYLILRDIFPDWAIESGVLKNRIITIIFKKIAQLQFGIFDEVGVQDTSAIGYIRDRYKVSAKLSVLPNWYPDLSDTRTDNVNVETEFYSNFTDFDINLVYTGNIGPAQNVQMLLSAFQLCSYDNMERVCLHIFGEGQDFSSLKSEYHGRQIKFYGSVPQQECIAAIKQCHACVFTLNSYLKSNNVPGKYMMYTSIGKPIFATVNKGNGVIDEIEKYGAGVAGCWKDQFETADMLSDFLQRLSKNMFKGSRAIYVDKFQYEKVATTLRTFISEKTASKEI